MKTINETKQELKLVPEMIPQTSFFTNLRSMLPSSRWDTIRKQCYRKANYVCEICGGVGPKHPVECHEMWEFNPKTKIQRLVKLIALCPDCHQAIHIGLASVYGKLDYAVSHLMKVNNISKAVADTLVDDAYELWNRRNRIEWELDISLVDSIEE